MTSSPGCSLVITSASQPRPLAAFLFHHRRHRHPYGLTDLGKELIVACNRLRILIDLSHHNERGFWDVAAISKAPLVATHSNAHALLSACGWR